VIEYFVEQSFIESIKQYWMPDKSSLYHCDQGYFLAGKQFSQLIMFMGCAPKIVLEPSKEDIQDANFVAIHLFESFQQGKFYPGKLPFNFRCPSCQQNQEINVAEMTCTVCHHQFDSAKQNWRQKAGYSQLFIEVMGIFESEAIPADKLLKGLENLTGIKWLYFYANESTWKQN